GVRAGVIFSRVHGETESGEMRAHRIAAIARSANVAICGGNCMGYVNLVDGLQVTGLPFANVGETGSITLVSHSGSTWAGIVGKRRNFGLNLAVSSGQELVITAAEYIKFAIERLESRVVACVLETVRAPEEFMDSLELADSHGVPVVVLKLGRS